MKAGHRLVIMLMTVELALLLGLSQANPAQIGHHRARLEDRQNLHPFHNQMKRDSGNDDDNTLRMTLILVFAIGIILTLLVLITICAVCMLHRARYGEFCCIKPKMRYPHSSLVTESDGDNEEDDELTPPHYDGSYLDRESPPVYTDALHDAVLAKGIDTSTIPLPPYSPGSEQEDVSLTILSTQHEHIQDTSISGAETDTTVEGIHIESSESSEPKTLSMTIESESMSVTV